MSETSKRPRGKARSCAFARARKLTLWRGPDARSPFPQDTSCRMLFAWPCKPMCRNCNTKNRVGYVVKFTRGNLHRVYTHGREAFAAAMPQTPSILTPLCWEKGWKRGRERKRETKRERKRKKSRQRESNIFNSSGGVGYSRCSIRICLYKTKLTDRVEFVGVSFFVKEREKKINR